MQRLILAAIALSLISAACTSAGVTEAAELPTTTVVVATTEATTATVETVAPTTTTTTTTVQPTTTTTVPDVAQPSMFDLFPKLPLMGSTQWGEIPSLVATMGVATYTSNWGSSRLCSAVDTSVVSVVGHNGEWALPYWFDTVLTWGSRPTVARFDDCLSATDLTTGWWGVEWEAAVKRN